MKRLFNFFYSYVKNDFLAFSYAWSFITTLCVFFGGLVFMVLAFLFLYYVVG